MKEIIAIIRPEKYLATVEVVMKLGIADGIEQRVLGRGRQGGLRYLRPSVGQQSQKVEFLPKRMLTWLVADEQAEALVDIIIHANRTSSYGDGKIFICPIVDIQISAEAHGAETKNG